MQFVQLAHEFEIGGRRWARQVIPLSEKFDSVLRRYDSAGVRIVIPVSGDSEREGTWQR